MKIPRMWGYCGSIRQPILDSSIVLLLQWKKLTAAKMPRELTTFCLWQKDLTTGARGLDLGRSRHVAYLKNIVRKGFFELTTEREFYRHFSPRRRRLRCPDPIASPLLC